MPETIRGAIEKVYCSGPNFSAGMLRSDEGRGVRFRGKFMATVHDVVALVGRWAIDPKYGHQFVVDHLDYDLPETAEGLVNYLAGHPAFTGIGAKTAQRIVDYAHSGEHLDRLIRQGVDELHHALRIPRTTLDNLRGTWIAQSAENEVRSYLASFELTPHQMDTLLETFGNAVVGVLRNNPYALIQAVKGYGFKKVDKIALAMGVPKDHAGRIEAGLVYCLSEQISNGHTWTPGSAPGIGLIEQANDLLMLDTLDSRDRIQAAGNRLLVSGTLVADGTAITLPTLLDAERAIHLAFAEHAWRHDPIIVPDDGCRGLNGGQRRAWELALTHPITVITGGAGTGKTHLVSRLTQAFQQADLHIALCAPTGKAAKRIEELLRLAGIALPAVTLHRLLEYDGTQFNRDSLSESRDQRDANGPSTTEPAYDVVIVDEVSMVDVPLMAELLERIDFHRTRLILVGDHNQLPPVGPGNVLRDIVQHELVPTGLLTQVERQAGVLKANAVAVLDGVVAPTAVDDPAWSVIDCFREPAQIQTYLRELVLEKLPQRMGCDPVRDVQIITPTHIGQLGTKAINQMMQMLLHPREDGHGKFAVGDKVIQCSNDYELGVMNGTIGYVTALESEKPGGYHVHFDGVGSRHIHGERIGAVQLAYALTAHKAQGSEFPVTVVLCHKSHYFADRNWLYTAVTRASRSCILLGDRWGLRHAAKKNRVIARRTFLDRWSAQRKEVAA